ncbi:DUF1145 domain-containing protein [Biformimicrobium ophioploci]|uniref:DUF1145 domain-containing protein n=1 Tax=Biformimicrobium ophioploci TaxID=3036711 RepID=A0ABQ6LXA6_9GAMM|nr:DUF1145 domain-containing protein [Microbulbifer sp. NKW57]GMG86693.1 hypothetical protein MNKW57_10140 [Microbulbifer sp. NKW57]
MLKKILKALMIILWLVILVSIVPGVDMPYEQGLQRLGLILVVVHLLEFAVFRARIRKQSENWKVTLPNTLLYGVLYWY